MPKPCPECGTPEMALVPEVRKGVDDQSEASKLFCSTPSVEGADFIMAGVGLVLDGVGAIGNLISSGTEKPEEKRMVLYCAKCGYWEPTEPPTA